MNEETGTLLGGVDHSASLRESVRLGRGRMKGMFRHNLVFVLFLGIALALLSSHSVAQIEQVPDSGKAPGQNEAPPRYDRDKEAQESSSRDTKVDLSPPKDDAKDHPFSDTTDAESPADTGPQELKPWDPHKAAKDVEVGDFYFKRKNYRAALARYQDALVWKDNDADANFRLGECFEKLNNPTEAAAHYQAYLKILPRGPEAPQAQKALERLKGKDTPSAAVPHPIQADGSGPRK